MKRYFIEALLIIILSSSFSFKALSAEITHQHDSGLVTDKRIVFGGDENFPPFLFRDNGGNPAGYHIDLIKAIAKALDYEVDIQLKQWDAVMHDLLVDKTIDITSLAYQKHREKIVLFSTPHLIESSEIYIRKKTRGIETLAGLHDKEIIVMRNATTYMNLKDLGFKAKYIFVDSEPEALILLSKGKHDAAIVGRHMGLSVVQRHNLKNLITVGEPLFPRDYVLATALDRQNLMDEINRGLKILKSDGQYDEINRKWFGTAQEQKHFLNRIIYGGLFIITPLLILASLSIIWNWSLKRKVNAKTSELQAELTERRKAETALLESEAKFKRLSKEFKAILDGIPGILALLDKKMRTVWCNKSDLDIFNHGNDSSFRKDMSSVIDSLIIQSDQSRIEQCFENGCEIDYICTDERGRTWEIRGFPMKNAQGQTTHALILANDVTENVQFREEAIAASRLASLGELSAGVAHEINNPQGLFFCIYP